VEADAGATVVDGSADALAGLAAFGALPEGRVAYAGDSPAEEIQRAREVVISDSNRRRVLAAARMAQNQGATLAADDPFSPDAAVLDLFPARGADAQTVATYDGARSLRTPFSPAYSQFPERRPFAAFDGNPATHWQADRALEEARHWLEIGFDAPRDVDTIELLPYSDRRARVTAVEVGGRTFPVRQGWNRLELGLRGVGSLRVRIARVVAPEGVQEGPGGIRELRIPGVAVREALRPPVLAERALADRDLARTGLTYLFERTTGDDPFRRDPRRGTAGATLVRDRQDGERGLERTIAPPAARAWQADGWGTVDPRAPDSRLDALAGARGGRFDSSGRFHGRPGFRASSAFDGGARPWIGSWLDGRTAWLRWRTPRPARLRELRLEAPREIVRRPTLVRLRAGAAVTAPLPVAADGTVTLPRPLTGRDFRLEVLRAAFPAGASGQERQRRAVGIGELRGAGLPRARVPRSGPVRARCGDLAGTLGTAELRLRVDATLPDLDAGRALRFRPCGRAAGVPAGPARLSMPPATFAPYLLRVRSPAPRPVATAATVPGRVADSGRPERDARTGVRLDLHAPAWLVLAQSYSDAWRASCDGRDLGAPVPVDGFAMGWRVPASCRAAEMAFAPDGLVRAGYLISLPVLLAMLLWLLLRRPPRPAPEPPPELPEPSSRRMPARRAAVLALLAGAVLGFVFAARAAPLIAAGTFLILWRGVGVRGLVAAAGALLLVAVPVLTLAIGVEDRGGYNPEYAQARIAVHWGTAAAVILLVLALARVLGAARHPRSPA